MENYRDGDLVYSLATLDTLQVVDDDGGGRVSVKRYGTTCSYKSKVDRDNLITLNEARRRLGLVSLEQAEADSRSARSGRTLDDAIRRRIKRLLGEGFSQRHVAQICCVDKKTVGKYAKK